MAARSSLRTEEEAAGACRIKDEFSTSELVAITTDPHGLSFQCERLILGVEPLVEVDERCLVYCVVVMRGMVEVRTRASTSMFGMVSGLAGSTTLDVPES